MVNVFQRLTRRAKSSGSAPPEPRRNSLGASSQSHDLHRTNTASSRRHSRRQDRAAEEPLPRHLVVISDTAEFDPNIIRKFQSEGFNVEYLQFVCNGDPEKGRKGLENAVHEREDEFETGERYAIVGKN